MTSKEKIRNIIVPFISTIIVLFIVWFGYQAIFTRKNNSVAFLSAPEGAPVSPTATPVNFNSNDIIVPSAEIDSDQDGLSNAMETLYKTQPENPDTDGDGYKDGDEVANGYDPLIPSPNDKVNRLALAITPDTSPLPTTPTLTQQYVNKTGVALTGDSLTTNEEQINKFINETNARGILPAILDSDIHIIATSGKAAIVKYLNTLSVAKNTKLKAVTPDQITAAFTILTGKKDAAPLDKVIVELRNNTAVFRAVDVPAELADLHKKYLAAVTALQINTEILKNYQTDYVGVLVAASRIEGLRAVFTEVENDIKALETKYNIK